MAKDNEPGQAPADDKEIKDAPAAGKDEHQGDDEPEAGDDEQDELSADEELEGGEDDAGEDVSEDERAPAQVRRRSANETIRELRARAQRAEESSRATADRLARMEAEIGNRSRSETEEQERARVALMSADEKIEHYRQKDRAEFTGYLRNIEFRTQEAADKAGFEAMCATNPVAKRLQADVEAKLAEMRAKGQNAERSVVLKFLIGERALNAQGAAGGKQRRRAAEAEERERARPGSPRGDGRAERRRISEDSPEGRAKRLENVRL